MANESAKCRYIDKSTNLGCENWYPYDPDEKYCLQHRNGAQLDIDEKNKYLIEYQEKYGKRGPQGVIELAQHIQDVEAQLKTVIKSLENQRWSANKVRRDLESELTEEERATTRERTRNYKGHAKEPKIKAHKPTPKKGAFVQNNIGMSMKEFAALSEEEQDAKVAKFLAAKKAARASGAPGMEKNEEKRTNPTEGI